MILVAPTSFKGTYSAAVVSRAIARAVRTHNHDCIERPVSDGGPGLIDALLAAQTGELHQTHVKGPMGDVVVARILGQGERAVIESADACGLDLVRPERREPMRASTFGVGELITAAAKYAKQIFVGLGGSATIDGGTGMARALGWTVEPDHVQGAFALDASVTALYDVRSPLYGRDGAARVFGAQKGATPEEIELLDARLQQLAEVLRRDLGIDVANVAGAGAAGGLGAGMMAFTNARLVSGSEWLLGEIGFDALLERAELLITGEGAYDAQSSLGKITGTLIERAQHKQVPVLLIAGSVSGALPANVHAVAGKGELSEDDIEQLADDALAQLLAH